MAKILIIDDDDEFVRDILSTRVENLNHDVLTAATLGQALDQACKND